MCCSMGWYSPERCGGTGPEHPDRKPQVEETSIPAPPCSLARVSRITSQLLLHTKVDTETGHRTPGILVAGPLWHPSCSA